MSKVLHAGLIPGTSTSVVSIYEGGDDNPLADPVGNLGRVYFDSRLDYLNIVAQGDVSVSLPYEQITTACGKKGKDCAAIVRSGVRSYTLFAHGQSYVPAILMYDLSTSRAVTGNMFLQTISNTSFRLCWVVVDGIYVYLKERWFVRYNDLGAIDKSFRIYVFNKPAI